MRIGDTQIEIEQSMPPTVANAIMSYLAQGKRLSIEFHLRITVKVPGQINTFQLQTWQGISCTKTSQPVVEGILVMLTAGAGVSTGSLAVRP